ncbi:AAA ATPase [Methylocella tundrae]|uniref:AAA ATPase n=1 Tax=Methylocella tundrae TaxID=227605 RepID=A0A4U8YXE1_METTU|nr:DNA polymerase III subunit delta' [Methylocella tundrae]WPP05582.1 DNA polymerase III subunit delta' [Methylocella tundrae]VFU08026.1 AAA ATPase [Methylocella tundrae]VTZ27383.1 AAA ATPase [Methylocella tundrae]VTZ52392.1 AAA ATPase [Methylocella tundrae]
MAPRLSTDAEAPPEADRFEDAPHPREASAFIGHAEAEAELLRACASGQLPQAFLIGGPSGVGKATLAWRLARFLLANPDARAAAEGARNLHVPPEHPAARQIHALSHPDLFLLRREWNEKGKKHYTEIRVEDVRRAIHTFQQSAGRGGYRICIVDSAEDLNASGANALLKLIEEPPPRSVFMIVSHRPGRVLATIRSRCRKIGLKELGSADIADVVKTLGAPWSGAKPAEVAAAIERSRESLHGVLRLLNGRGLELDSSLRRILDDLPRIDWRAAHALADQVAPRDGGDDYETLLATVFDWLEAKVRGGALDGEGAPRQLAPYAEVWEKVTEAAQQTEALNLDKRPFVLALFADLAAAARASSL